MNSPPFLIQRASGLDVLAVLPARIGFHPTDSIVIAGLHPPRGRLGIVIRADRLPLDSETVASVALERVELLFGAGARSAFVVRYAPAGDLGIGEDRSFWTWVEMVKARLPIAACWDVTGELYQEVDPGLRAPIGRSYRPADLQSTRAAATVALAGMTVKATRADLAKIELAPRAARKAAQAAERRAADQALAMGPDSIRRWRLTGLENWTEWHHQLLEKPDTAVPPSRLGRIAALLADRIGRDAVMACAFKRCGNIPRQLVLGHNVASLFDPWKSAGLDYACADAGLALLEQVAAHLIVRRRGSVYALGAAWHWWYGNGAAAEEWARAGIDCNDCPQLAALILAVVNRGIFPAALEGSRL